MADKSGGVMAKRIEEVFNPHDAAHIVGYNFYRLVGHWPHGMWSNEVWFPPGWEEIVKKRLDEVPAPMETKAMLKEYNRILEVVRSVVYPGYEVHAEPFAGKYVIYLTYDEPRVISGEPAIQKTREWLIEPGSTNGQIVQTILKAALASAEHRVRENLLYRGKPVLQPHLDVDKLVALMENEGREHKVNQVFCVEEGLKDK